MLVDLLLLIELGLRDEPLRAAVQEVFSSRGSHVLPAALAAPPEDWRADFEELATQTGLRDASLAEGFARLVALWEDSGLADLASG